MKRGTYLYFIISIFILGFLGSCTEPFEIEEIDYESILVVESTLTNEMKQHTVRISRTSVLNDTTVTIEENANVSIEVASGDQYTFTQNEQGIYVSDEAFQANNNTTYQLLITTQDGQTYQSANVALTPEAQITNVYAEQAIKNGVLGAQVYVDATSTSGESNYFRYEFEETYKISVPVPTDSIGQIINYDRFGDEGFPLYNIIQVLKEEDDKTCYRTQYSDGILLANTNNLNQNSIERYPVQFIEADNPVLLTRYSILVKQYVQSLEAYTFYQVLKDLGSPESLLSESQPGYVSGNINVQGDPDAKVLGYFDVASVSQRRLFFNYADVQLTPPPYFVSCEPLTLNYLKRVAGPDADDERSRIYSLYTLNDYRIILVRFPNYTLVPPECNDCRVLGSNIRPDFWED